MEKGFWNVPTPTLTRIGSTGTFQHSLVWQSVAQQAYLADPDSETLKSEMALKTFP